MQLAIGEQAQTVYADPRQVTDPRREAAVIARTLRLDLATVYQSLTDRTRGFVYVARKADPALVAKLRRKGLPGINSYGEERRFYPQFSLASQVLGYAGVDNRGLAGLELSLDKDLAGRPGKETVVKDASGQPIDTVVSQTERDGRDVYLTLDHTIQANAQAVLRDTVLRWHAKSATAIVLDPTTGAVRAMAIAPGFDANIYPKVWRVLQRNRAVTDTYEPGSTFKLVTVAGALSEGLVTPTTRFTLPYELQVADRKIHDAEPRGTETMTVSEILSRSSNVGAITLAERLTRHRLVHWISRFGFGHLTGIDFPGESAGIVLPEDKWSGSSIGNIPIGQGIAVTPIQMASAYAAIANRGVWVRPHLVDHVGDGVHGEARPEASRLGLGRARGDGDAEERGGRGHRHAGRGARVPGRRQDRHRSQAGRTRRLLRLALRRLVRRRRAGLAAAARDPRLGGRASGRHLGRRRRRAGVRADREVRPSVPRRRRAPGRPVDHDLDGDVRPLGSRSTVRPASSPRRAYRGSARVSVAEVSQKCCKGAVLGSRGGTVPAGAGGRLAPRWRSTS